MYKIVSEYANYTSGMFQLTPYGPRNLTHIDGSHFSFYIGMNDTWTADVLASMKSADEYMAERDANYE